MSILAHPMWPLVRYYLRVEPYSKDTGPRGARIRLEIITPKLIGVRKALLAIEMPCVACGTPIHPIRLREKYDTYYYAATCPLEVRVGCARGSAAREEYVAVRAAVDTFHAKAG